MDLDHRIFKLKGVVQHYSWGGYDFIPQLLGLENSDHKPFAEYWLGAHTNHPALVQNEKEIALDNFIAQDIPAVLGKRVAEKFGSLPYLFKVLDVRQMLSIQVHPSKQVAEQSFEEEENKGIPVNAPHRNYKDRNHKPELMAALGDFWLLHGFKPQKELERILDRNKEFHFLKETFQKSRYKGLYEGVMQMEPARVDEVLEPLVKRIIPLYESGSLQKDNEDFWAARAALAFCRDGHYDRGIFSVYFFNLVHLKTGEGIYQPSGLPHAYLEGQNVEIMANSDNVLRAGLTDKHIDVSELMKHVKFDATVPAIISPNAKHNVYSSPAEEFELQQYALEQGEEASLRTTTGEVLLVLEGAVHISSEEKEMDLSRGDAVFVLAGTDLGVKASSGTSLFRVTVPRG